MKKEYTRQTFLCVVILLPVFILSSCADGQGIGSLFASPTPTATQTATPTLTPSPTLTPTLSLAERPIDLEMLYNFPESYEYLLAHLDEFVQAPDPLTAPVDFDHWFDEEFGPALGPVADRPLNFPVDTIGSGYSS